MTFRTHLSRFISIILVCFSFNSELLAAIKISRVSGTWSNAATWGGSVPAADDDIIVSSGTTVSINTTLLVSLSFGNITVERGGFLVVGVNDVKLRIKGNIINDGTINFWQSSTYQADIFLYGNSVWSGAGIWNLSNINVQNHSLEPAEGLTLTLNGSLTAYAGSSFNKLNRYHNITINIKGTLNTMISSYPDFYYGHLIVNKTPDPNLPTPTVKFSPSTSFNMINLLGNLTLVNSTDRLIVEDYNTLTLLGSVTGAGSIQGSSTSSLVVDNLDAPAINPLRILGGTHFRDFSINRRAGVTLSNGFIIRESLRLNNSCLLTLPAQTLTLGLNGTNPTAGSFFGDGTMVGSNNSSISIRGKDTASVKLRFHQGSVSSHTLNSLIIDKPAGKVMLEAGNLLLTSKLDISDRNIFAIGAGTLIVNIVPSFSGSGCLSGSRDANLKIAGTSLTGYPLIFDQFTPFGNSLKSYIQSRNAVITLGNKLNIFESVSLTGNSSVLVSDGNLTLLSLPDGSAGISSLLENTDVRGDVNVQVYISGDSENLKFRGSRSLSSPLNDHQIVADKKKSLEQLKDYIIITGPGGVNNGFDQGGNAQPFAATISTYNPLAARGFPAFNPVNSISQSIIPGTGFFAFFVGKQMGNYSLNSTKLNSPYGPPEPVTVNYIGPINKFDIPSTVLRYNNDSSDIYSGYNLIGNPYPSSIDWTKVARDPGVNDEVLTSKPCGGTATYKNGFSNNGGSPYIPTGQGFFVKTSVDGSSVTFKESCKTFLSPARLLSAPVGDGILTYNHSFKLKSDFDVIRVVLGNEAVKEETTIVFTESEMPEADNNDALYFSGGTVRLASLSTDSKKMAINFMPEIELVEQVNLSVNANSSGSFNLNFTEIPISVSIFLKDTFKGGKLTEVKKSLCYSFEIDRSQPETFGDNRFSLLFKHKTKTDENIPVEKSSSARAFPNPVVNDVTFDLEFPLDSPVEVLIFDMEGKVLEKFTFRKYEKLRADLSWLQPGIYGAKFRSAETGKAAGETLFIKH